MPPDMGTNPHFKFLGCVKDALAVSNTAPKMYGSLPLKKNSNIKESRYTYVPTYGKIHMRVLLILSCAKLCKIQVFEDPAVARAAGYIVIRS